MSEAARIAVITAMALVIAVFPASPRLIKCPDNRHIWAESSAECFPHYGITIGGGAGQRCGGLCGVIRRIPGVGGLLS